MDSPMSKSSPSSARPMKVKQKYKKSGRCIRWGKGMPNPALETWLCQLHLYLVVRTYGEFSERRAACKASDPSEAMAEHVDPEKFLDGCKGRARTEFQMLWV